ncbi:ribosomal-protein-alanine acetyltransferase [Fictibacillus macauensis ZFHKF-1]|uniref:Ribosomal-protein-alanine acetyltransferase n=1 Tax=Fictibacillus macauensis ZFHKF-1 TaxID=1196324 RepID=I8UJL5_9BACL|nr:GNAT family N-acetyltransferase [Fictibacillus macauensis]EIT87003.1 ribosomal-protein-alanine acetyltransferase [Fictibacillus macauensis ZFHKF-1]
MESERLSFRPYTEHDLSFYTSLWRDEEVVRYIGRGQTKTAEEAKRSFLQWLLPAYKNGYGLFVILEKKTGELIGHAGLVPQVVDHKKELELGYWLAKDYWKQGYAREAARYFVAHAQQTLQQNRLISLIHPYNTASIAVAKAVGMLYEKTVFFNGNVTRVYSLK